MILKEDLYNFIFLLTVITFSFLIIIFSENTTIHILSFWIIVIFSMHIIKYNITHPLFWFSVSYGLYSTGYTILYSLGYITKNGYTKDNILLSMLSLSIVILIVGVKNERLGCYLENRSILEENISYNATKLILKILLAILFICVIKIYRTPFSHKNEILLSRNKYFILAAYLSRFISFYNIIYILLFKNIDKKKNRTIIVLSSIMIFAFSMFTGERDAILRFIIVITITLYITGDITNKKLIYLAPFGILFLMFIRYFKYYFVSGEINKTLVNQSFVYKLLTSDFHAAGENFQILLNNDWTNSLFGYSLVIIDILSPFLPGKYFFNVGTWFNDYFYFRSYSRAFTLLGEGYVIGGIIGIVVVFALLGILIKFLYKKSSKNIYWLSLYIYSIPTIILSFRSTMSTIFIGLLRIGFLSIVVHWTLVITFNINKKRT